MHALRISNKHTKRARAGAKAGARAGARAGVAKL